MSGELNAVLGRSMTVLEIHDFISGEFEPVPLQDVWVTANFKETQLDKLRVGQSVQLTVDAYNGAAIEGVVQSISAATGARFTLLPPDNASGNFTKVVQRVPVRIRITKGLDAVRPLRIGLSVVAHVSTQ